MSKRGAIIAVSAALLIGFVALVIHNYKTKTSFKYAEKTAQELKPEQNPQDAVTAEVNKEAKEDAITEARRDSELLKVLPEDFVLGDKAAPVLLIEYASLSCPHCADFAREAFEKLKSEYVDSGKIKFVFRNFPLNQPALVAAMFAECQANDNKDRAGEKYFSTLKALFKTQDTWAFDEKFSEKLEAIAQLDGMSSDRFKKCISDKSLQEKILTSRMEASKSLQLRSTPSFFINGEISEGFVDYKSLKKLIDAKLSEKK
ncbi:MAG: DsbA family protein [Proteobacteria bacterium]|nr:DsbA family protein [Pseudomonadota bacterium]